MSSPRTKPSLGPGLWIFIVTRILGILLNGAFLILGAVWALPAVDALEGGDYTGGMLAELLLPLVEIAATLTGLVLIARRSPSVRRYWLAYLCVLCVVQLWQMLGAPEPAGAAVFFAASLGWLAYWVWAPRARQLPLEGFWTHPESLGPENRSGGA